MLWYINIYFLNLLLVNHKRYTIYKCMNGDHNHQPKYYKGAISSLLKKKKKLLRDATAGTHTQVMMRIEYSFLLAV